MQISSSNKSRAANRMARSWLVMRLCFYLAVTGIAVSTFLWNQNKHSHAYYSWSLLTPANDEWEDSSTTTTPTSTTFRHNNNNNINNDNNDDDDYDSIRDNQVQNNNNDDVEFELDDFFFDLQIQQQQQQQTRLQNTDDVNWKGYHANRTIALVHVGKAGGLTIRRATSLVCRLTNRARNQTETERQPCIDKFFEPSAVLARQVQYYFHMHGYRPDDIRDASSFLFVLRNPIDRIVSTYKYSHPANCNPAVQQQRQVVKPWGCNVLERSQEPGTREYKVYTTCFPSAAMEAFAQSVQSPFGSLPIAAATIHSNTTTTTSITNTILETEQNTCRSVAHSMVVGKGPVRPAPHMYYNYAYYTARTTQFYPHKTVFGIRTDHEWEDIQTLDLTIGGTGRFRHQGRTISHGSEGYHPSPLSPHAYRKLCCVLHDEIVHYRTLLQQVVNFNVTVKHECMQQIRTQCGISTSFAAWRQTCQQRIQQDAPMLQRYRLSPTEKQQQPQQQQQPGQQQQRGRQRQGNHPVFPPRAKGDRAAIKDRMRQRLSATLNMMKQNNDDDDDDNDVDDVGDEDAAGLLLER